MTRSVVAVLGALAATALAPAASASITIATNAQAPALRVDARGNAEVSWSSGGARRYVLVPPRGRVFPGRRLAGRDVSRPFRLALPFRRVVRRTPDGRLWALQAWRPARNGIVELRFSRWRGAPTKITLAARPSRNTEILSGRATFQGRPVFGTSPTPEGTPILLAAVLECYACGGRPGWTWFNSKRTSRSGSFAATVPLNRRSRRYRAIIAGPNRGTTLAPDASAVVASSL